MSDNRPDEQPVGHGLSRRTFMYGSAAAAMGAAGAVLLGGYGSAASAAPLSTPDASGGGFSLKQPPGAAQDGTGSVTVKLGKASTAGTLLVATLLTTDPNHQFTPPSGQPGWRLAKKVVATPGGGSTSQYGHVEIWYYPGLPPAPGNPGNILTSKFTLPGGSTADCRGSMAEFALPKGAMTVLDAPGAAAGTGNSFKITPAAGNAPNALGVVAVADFFNGSVTSSMTWTAPSSWTGLQHVSTGAPDLWAAWYDLGLPTGTPTALDFGLTGTPNATETAWAAAYAAFRAITFRSLWLNGAEMTNVAALDPTGQQLILGGDVEGVWRSADAGDHWQVSENGLYGDAWRCFAAVEWSRFEPGTVYACVGKDASKHDGGFLVSADGGVTWAMRASGSDPSTPFLVFQSNAPGNPPAPPSEAQDADRSVGHLIAQEPSSGNIYVATYNQGVAMSSDNGHTWSQVTGALTGGNYYPRAIALDDASGATAGEFWVGLWDSDQTGTYGGIRQRTPGAAQEWTTLPNPVTPGAGETNTVSYLKVIGGYLYAAYTTLGIFRWDLANGGWTALNDGTLIQPVTANYQLWTSLDGYVDGSGNHQIIVGCSNQGKSKRIGTNPQFTNLVQITISKKGVIGPYTDLTGATQIDLADVAPLADGHPYWRDGSSWSYWLGGHDFVNPHILIDQNDPTRQTIYVTGAGGFFRTANGGKNWQIAVNGAPMGGVNTLVTDPVAADHVVLCGSDFTHIDLTDPTGWNTAAITETNPGANAAQAVESHAGAIDPSGSLIFAGINYKYGKNQGGDVLVRKAGTTAWTSTGYANVVPPGPGSANGSNAPIGMFSGHDNAGNRFIVVAVDGGKQKGQGGMWRATSPLTGTGFGAWTWQTTPVNAGIGSQYSAVQDLPIVGNSSGQYLYCFDHANGIYRSSDWGQSWTLIWDLSNSAYTPVPTVTDIRSGWLALNPTVAGELWVSGSNGLFRLSGAGTGTVGNGISVDRPASSSFPFGAGGVVFAASGNSPYVVALNGGTDNNGVFSPGTPARLLKLTRPATGSTTWGVIDIGGDSFSSYAGWPGQAVMTGSGVLMVADAQNFAVYGTPSA